MTNDQLFAALAAEFPRDAVHWRAQTLTKDGTKALALAYLDARDVMDRLDSACTPAGWSNSVVETAKGRLISTIQIKIDGEWIGKTDGAGDTAVEGEKGGISDAIKRAAVLWGVGRYLYRLPNVWAPCESKEFNNKLQWKAWKGSPWDHVRSSANVSAVPDPVIDDAQWAELTTLIEQTGTNVVDVCKHYEIASLRELPAARFAGLSANLRGKLVKAA